MSGLQNSFEIVAVVRPRHQRAQAMALLKRSCLLAAMAAASLGAATVHADVYDFTIDQSASSATTSSDVTAPLAGTFIGNYDAATNPTGTMTRPGLVGGSGNMPISYSGTVTGSAQTQSNPIGGRQFDINVAGNAVSVSNFYLDVFAGNKPSFPATFNVLYQTFRTFQPNSTFIGGVTLPVPLGEMTLTSLTITQTSTSDSGTLTPRGGGNAYTISLIVQVDVSFTGVFNNIPLDGTIPAALPVSGTLTLNGNSADATMSVNWATDQVNTGPFEPFVALPLDVPTVLPSGSTAHLLVSGTVQSVTMHLAIGAAIASHGQLVQPPRPADINGDGVVNVTDLLAVIHGWGVCPAPPTSCPADIAPQPGGDGVVNVTDLLMVLNQWG